MTRSEIPRSRLSVGYEWATRATSVGLEFALPPLAGAYLDRWWGTTPLCILAGAFLGFGLGMVHILRFARLGTVENSRPDPPTPKPPPA